MRTYAVLTISAAIFTCHLVADTKVKLGDLPQAVQAAMKQQTKDATVLGASKEQENGRMTYEIETKVSGKTRDLTFDESGALLEVEQEVAIDSIPAAARQAIQKKAAGGTIQKVESVTQGSAVSYEADVKHRSGKKTEVAVNADGAAHKE